MNKKIDKNSYFIINMKTCICVKIQKYNQYKYNYERTSIIINIIHIIIQSNPLMRLANNISFTIIVTRFA